MSAVVNQPEFTYRSAVMVDIPAIMAIEERVYPFPWTRRIFADCIRVGYHCELVLLNDQVIAYAIMSVGANEAHLLNLCVDPDWQHQGVGRELLVHMLKLADEQLVDTMFLEVRPSNKVALKLYEKFAFNIIGEREDYYPAKDGREDAVILARTFLR